MRPGLYFPPARTATILLIGPCLNFHRCPPLPPPRLCGVSGEVQYSTVTVRYPWRIPRITYAVLCTLHSMYSTIHISTNIYYGAVLAVRLQFDLLMLMALHIHSTAHTLYRTKYRMGGRPTTSSSLLWCTFYLHFL